MSQKTRIFIYILIAAAAVIMGVLGILQRDSGGNSGSVTAQEKIDLGRNYLIALSYSKAVIEFTDAIEIEPLNADAYLGLAEAYEGLGDTEKAVETLETGYEMTGDERLKEMLERLTAGMSAEAETEGTTLTTTAAATTTAETTTDEANTDAVEDVTNEELESILLTLIEDPNADIEQSKLDAVTCISIFGKDFFAVNNSVWDKYKLSGYSYYDEYYGKTYEIRFENDNESHKYEYGTISDINFLSRFKNLESLEILFNPVTDINPLNKLTKLTCLNMPHCRINDISVLSSLTNLTILELSFNQISDISPLSNLTNLTILLLGENRISDISPLSNLTNLTILQFGENQISDISALSNLTNLQFLNLRDNQITEADIEELKKALPNCQIDY